MEEFYIETDTYNTYNRRNLHLKKIKKRRKSKKFKLKMQNREVRQQIRKIFEVILRGKDTNEPKEE